MVSRRAVGQHADGDTKTALMKAGLNLIASNGYHRMKVSDVVHSAGLTQASFYWYFKSKLEMALEVIKDGRQKLLEVIKTGYREEHASVEDMLTNSKHLVLRLLEFAEQHRDFMVVLIARGHGADPKLDSAISETRKDFFNALKRNVSRAQELNMLPQSANLELTSVFLHRLIEGAIEWRLFGHDYQDNVSHEIDNETFAAQLVDFEFFGLLHMSDPKVTKVPQ